MSKTEYNWFKRGKEHRRTADPEGKLPTLVKPTPNTEIRFEYHDDDDDDDDDGSLEYEGHYKDGKRHRDGDKPARVWYNKDGSVKYAAYYKNGIRYTPLSKVS